jgi:DNA-binding MarR family transcriptional regulator
MLRCGMYERSRLNPKPIVYPIANHILRLVRAEDRDLSLRQLAVLVTCHMMQGPPTVRALAAFLNLSKAPITRAVNRLEALGLVVRLPDPRDRRSVLIQETGRGRDFCLRLEN